MSIDFDLFECKPSENNQLVRDLQKKKNEINERCEISQTVKLEILKNPLFWILVEYDYIHTPSNWDPEFNHEKVIKDWMEYIIENDEYKEDIDEILNLALKKIQCEGKEAYIEYLKPGGEISNILFYLMIDYFT